MESRERHQAWCHVIENDRSNSHNMTFFALQDKYLYFSCISFIFIVCLPESNPNILLYPFVLSKSRSLDDCIILEIYEQVTLENPLSLLEHKACIKVLEKSFLCPGILLENSCKFGVPWLCEPYDHKVLVGIPIRLHCEPMILVSQVHIAEIFR